MDIIDYLNKDIKHHTIVTNGFCTLSEARLLLQENEFNKLAYLYRGINEYEGIDFSEAVISLELWPAQEISKLSFPRWSKEDYNKKLEASSPDSYKDWDSNMLISIRNTRVDAWKQTGTWLTPIIIIDLYSFDNSNSETPFQLFEGHTRLLRFKTLYKHKTFTLNNSHLVFVISKNKL